jgi:glycosyltransferase involved in cell wall biosynthesis
VATPILLVLEEVNFGGAELSFLELCRSLASRCDVHLALDARNLSQPAVATIRSSPPSAAVTLHPCAARLNQGTVANLHRVLRRRPALEISGLIDAIRPVAILVNLPTVERGQAILDGAQLTAARPPVWGLLHLVQAPSTIGAKLGWVRDLLVGSLIRRFDRLLTVSQVGARKLAERYHIPTPDVLHPPTGALQAIGASAERDRRRAQEGLPDTFLLGIVGRVQLRQKGHDVALRVAARLLHSGHQLHLVVIGDGPDMTVVRRMAGELSISSSVTFLGWRDDAAALIPLLDAVLLPSRFEGLPQTALQAATARVPVIGYAVDGLGDLLPPDFQVPYGDEEGLASIVRELLQGTRSWPAQELAERAAAWGDPAAAADRLLTLLANGAERRPGR